MEKPGWNIVKAAEQGIEMVTLRSHHGAIRSAKAMAWSQAVYLYGQMGEAVQREFTRGLDRVAAIVE